MVDGTKKFPLSKPEKKVLDGNDGMCSGISGSRVFPHQENYASARQCTRTTKNWRKRQKTVKQEQSPSTTTKVKIMTNLTKQVNKGES